jgi:hypothetical protein
MKRLPPLRRHERLKGPQTPKEALKGLNLTPEQRDILVAGMVRLRDKATDLARVLDSAPAARVYKRNFEAARVAVANLSKYPPAKPGALGCEPLKAVGRVADAAR